jgi:hypothetical protein
MTIHLYQQTKPEAYRLSERSLLKLGFSLQVADDMKGLISARKQLNQPGHFIFFDIKVNPGRHCISLSLVCNHFSGSTGIFIADAVSEELFLETFHDLLRIQPPDNPMKLSYNDYALAAGF